MALQDTGPGGGPAPAIAPPVSLTPSPPPTPFQQQEMAYQPPPVVDRVAYLDQLKQAWTAAESARIEQERQALALFYNTGPMGAIRRATNLATGIGTGALSVDYANPAPAPKPYEVNIQPPSPLPGEAPGRPVSGTLPFDFAANAATTEIPGMKKVANVAGQVAGAVAPEVLSRIPVAQNAATLADLIPGVNVEGAASKTAQVGAESLVPTQVWQAALTLLPAAKARTIPELLSAITIGDTDAITALRNAGKNLGESPKVESLLAKLGGQEGFLRLSGEKPVWEMTAAEVRRSAIAQADLEKNAASRVFGEEGAKAYNAAQRTANSINASREAQQRADAVIARMEAKLTPEQQRVLFGIGETGPNADELRYIASKMGQLDYSSPEALGDSLKWAITKVSPGANPATMNTEELAAYMQIKHALEQATTAGWNTNVVSTHALGGAAERFATEDRAVMLQDFVRPTSTANRIAGFLRGGESGMARIPGEEAIKVGTRAIVPSQKGRVGVVAAIDDAGNATLRFVAADGTVQYSSVPLDALKVAKKQLNMPLSEQSRVLTGGVKDVMSVAERYSQNSPTRQALTEVLNEKIAGLPEVNQKFIRLSLDTLPQKGARQAATEAQRARQAANAAEVLARPGSEVEKATAGFKALGGKQAQRFTPMGGSFTDGETADLFGQIAQAADAKKIGIFDRLNATSALNLLLTGERLPGVASEAAKPLNLMPHEIKLLGRIFGPEFEQAIPKSAAHISGWQKTVDLLNLPRALVTALDFSAAGRQGIMLAPRNLKEWTLSFGPMLRAMGSEQGLQKVGQNIIKNPKYEDAVIHGLELTDIGGGAKAEEAFISSIASHIPFVRGSERGYVAYLDNLRMLTYEKYANRLEAFAQGKGWDVARTDAAKSNLARFLNHATGRGTLPGLEEYTPALNAVFFAPRYFASRPQSVWDLVRPGTDRFTRQVAMENLGAFVGAGVGALGAAKLAGADVELDPRSSDFGRMKFGPTRIDFWGGFQPIARYVAQIATAKAKNASTGQVAFANPGDTILRFVRSKLSPAGATLYDYTIGKQKDYQGNDLLMSPKDLGWNTDTGTLAKNVFLSKILPLSIQDMINGYQTQGIGGAIGAGLVSTLGGGVSSYEPSEKQQATINTIKFEKDVLAPANARIEGGAVWPKVLDSDFISPAWRSEFQKDVGELGDLSKYKNLSELRQAYVDYWYAKKGNDANAGEQTTKARFAATFDKYDSVKLWAKNVAQERAALYKRYPDLVNQAHQNDIETPGVPK